MLSVAIIATVLITLAELGDKTQLLALALAARYRTRDVVVGVVAAIVALQLLATAAGRVVGGLIPESVLSVVTGLLFIGFGVWTLRADPAEEEEEAAERAGFGPVVTVFFAFFLAELGDKTQILAMTIAADPYAALRSLGTAASWLPVARTEAGGLATFLGVWLGAVAGMIIADGGAILVGTLLGQRLPERRIKQVSGVLFILFGLAVLAGRFL